MNLWIFAAVAIAGYTQPAAAQFVAPTANQLKPCSEHRIEPPFLDAIDFREAYKKTLIQRMYTAQSFTKVAETNDCSCSNRFPDWDATIEYYQDHYAGIDDRFEIDRQTSYYEGVTNELRTDVRSICVSQGNW